MLWILGGLLMLAALLSGGACFISLMERSKYGPGLFFADVEIFAVMMLFFVGVGGLLMWIAKRLTRSPRPDTPDAPPSAPTT